MNQNFYVHFLRDEFLVNIRREDMEKTINKSRAKIYADREEKHKLCQSYTNFFKECHSKINDLMKSTQDKDTKKAGVMLILGDIRLEILEKQLNVDFFEEFFSSGLLEHMINFISEDFDGFSDLQLAALWIISTQMNGSFENIRPILEETSLIDSVLRHISKEPKDLNLNHFCDAIMSITNIIINGGEIIRDNMITRGVIDDVLAKYYYLKEKSPRNKNVDLTKTTAWFFTTILEAPYPDPGYLSGLYSKLLDFYVEAIRESEHKEVLVETIYGIQNFLLMDPTNPFFSKVDSQRLGYLMNPKYGKIEDDLIDLFFKLKENKFVNDMIQRILCKMIVVNTENSRFYSEKFLGFLQNLFESNKFKRRAFVAFTISNLFATRKDNLCIQVNNNSLILSLQSHLNASSPMTKQQISHTFLNFIQCAESDLLTTFLSLYENYVYDVIAESLGVSENISVDFLWNMLLIFNGLLLHGVASKDIDDFPKENSVAERFKKVNNIQEIENLLNHSNPKISSSMQQILETYFNDANQVL